MPILGIGRGLQYRRNSVLAPAVPTALSSSFTVNTISGDLTWTDNSGGKAQYEVYSSTNSGAYVLLGTTVAGATSYSDTACKQNASVVYRIRAKKGVFYSDYTTATAISTPLCWKTNQSTLGTVTIATFNVSADKTINIDWGDGTNANYTGNNSSITKNYSATGIYNIKLSGDLNELLYIDHSGQSKSYGNLTNWILPTKMTNLRIFTNSFSGDWTNTLMPTGIVQFYTFNNQFTGFSTNISSSTSGIIYQTYSNNLTGSNITVFRVAMTTCDIKNQNSLFPTSEVDKFFKAAADWYQVNTPTANCTYNLSGANMGIPTGGASNVDIVRLIGYYTAAGKTATVVVRTS